MSIMINRTVDIIAAEILNIKEQTVRQVLSNSIEIGRRLEEAKEIVPQGEWGNWLENTVDFKKSTANNLMRIFKEYGSDQLSLIGDNVKSQTLGKLSYSQAITLLSIPEEERENFIVENNVEDLSSRELKKKVDENRKLKKDLAEQKEKTETIKQQAEQTKKINLALQKKYEENEAKIRELEERPIEVNAVDEEKEKELIKLRAENKELDKVKAEKAELEDKILSSESTVQSDGVVRYSVYIDSIVNEFNKLLEELDKMPEEEKEQFTNVTKEIIKQILERL